MIQCWIYVEIISSNETEISKDGDINLFNFITKKYIDRIKKLEKQIELMEWEWDQEKQLYGKKTKKRFLKQKVDWVIGGFDLKPCVEIHRPMYGLTPAEAKEICNAIKCHLSKLGFIARIRFHWNENESCFVLDVEIIDRK